MQIVKWFRYIRALLIDFMNDFSQLYMNGWYEQHIHDHINTSWWQWWWWKREKRTSSFRQKCASKCLIRTKTLRIYFNFFVFSCELSLRLCVDQKADARAFGFRQWPCSNFKTILSEQLTNLFAKMAFRIVKMTPNFARMMSTNATTVGFIGLGQMGNRMATNLINKVKQLRRRSSKMIRNWPRDGPTNVAVRKLSER